PRHPPRPDDRPPHRIDRSRSSFSFSFFPPPDVTPPSPILNRHPAIMRHALRSLARTPAFTAVVLLSLALGIGANTTVQCWIRHILHEPIPGVTHADQLVALVSNEGGGNISLLDSRDFNTLDTVFSGVAVSQITPASLSVDDSPE